MGSSVFQASSARCVPILSNAPLFELPSLTSAHFQPITIFRLLPCSLTRQLAKPDFALTLRVFTYKVMYAYTSDSFPTHRSPASTYSSGNMVFPHCCTMIP
uniref:Secreted protein n=1 Tax=Steinernema glaseri TaxID=37863 RepID=A0A1I8AKR9_9BILA